MTEKEVDAELKLMEEIAIMEASTSLIKFVEHVKIDYDTQWFHKEICKYLDMLYEGVIKKLMIFIPPQHGKSTLSSMMFPAYILGRDPSSKIAICSYSSDLSSGFNRKCQQILDDPLYEDIFPGTKLNSQNVSTDARRGVLRNTNIFEVVDHKGFVKTVGVGGGLTGTPVDIGIVDDPFKDRMDANSEAIRKKTWEWYEDVFKTRLHNDSKQLMLYTRWHEDDLAGRILDPKNKFYDADEAKEWTVIAFPALKESEKPLPQAEDIDDKREIDEALWPSRHAAEKYIRKRKTNPTSFNSLDQQRPSAIEGNKIKKEWWEIISERELPFNPDEISPDFFIDGAFTDKSENDESAVGSCYFNPKDQKLYVFNIHGVRKELHEFLKYFLPFCKANHYKPQSNVFIELKASGEGMKSMLKTSEWGAMNARGIDNKVVRYGKLNRVENSEPFIASQRVVLVKGAWNASFIEQCGGFPNATHDDMVDVICYMVHQYFIKQPKKGVKYS